MATFPIIETSGMTKMPNFKFFVISMKVSVWLPTVLENGGGLTIGRPASI